MNVSYISHICGTSTPSVVLIEDEWASSALYAVSLFGPSRVFVSNENAQLLAEDSPRIKTSRVEELDEDRFFSEQPLFSKGSRPCFFSVEQLIMRHGVRRVATQVELLKRCPSSLVIFVLHADCLEAAARDRFRAVFDAVVRVDAEAVYPAYRIRVEFRRKGNKMLRGSDEFVITPTALKYQSSAAAVEEAPRVEEPGAVVTTDHLAGLEDTDSAFLKPYLAARKRIEIEVEEEEVVEEDLDDDLDF